MIDEEQHAGAVSSRVSARALIQDPITVTIEGTCTELSLDDARALLNGLGRAVERVEAAERALRGDGAKYNLLVIGKAGTGMSRSRSRLG